MPSVQSAKPNVANDVEMGSLAVLAPLWATKGAKSSRTIAASAWHRHDPTGTCMPEGGGSFQLKNYVDSSADDRGVSLISTDHVILSFFTYPASHSLDDEIEDIARAMCGGARAIATGKVTDARFPKPGVVAACEHETKYGEATEQALVFRDDSWFYEARFTFFEGKLSDQYDLAMALVQIAFRACAK